MTKFAWAGMTLACLTSDVAIAAPEVRDMPTSVTAVSAEDLANLPSGPSIEALIRSCPAGALPTLSPRVREVPSRSPFEANCLQPDDIRMIEIYRAHLDVRREVGVRPLLWDPALAKAAQAYAENLSRTGRLVHAPREGRGITRENLSQGMLGWSPRQMTGNWLREQSNFRPGLYPNVSLTGRWEDVSHYTQMIWPTTTTVGCGMADGSGFRWLVCRYAPGGNKDGKPVGQGFADGPKTATPPADVAPVGSTNPPGPPPPPPPPTARDDAPGGDESRHPLVSFANNSADAFTQAWRNGDRAAQERELAKMRYALDELRKRLKAARKVPEQFRSIDPAKVEEQVRQLERTLERATDRYHGREEFGG